MLQHIADARISNVVILTSDEHVIYAGEVHLDSRKVGSNRVAVEFTSMSISSVGDVQDQTANDQAVLSANTSLKFVNGQRGFMLCNVTNDKWETSVRMLDKVSEPDGRVSTWATPSVTLGSNRVAIG